MPNDPAVSAIPWGLEMTGSLSGGRDSLEGEAASALIFHPISKPTVNDYVPFFGVPAPPPTDRKILEKTETDRAEIFGEKISEKWDLQLCDCARKSAAITGSSKGMRPAYPLLWRCRSRSMPRLVEAGFAGTIAPQ
jgi:hypothetical protein